MAEAARIQTPYLVAEDDLDRSLRPRRLADFVGQEPLREQLAVAIEASTARGEALDHLLLAGPPGLGKTSLAHIVATELEVPLVQTAGPALERKGDVAAFLTALEPRSVFFVDEIHRLPRVANRLLKRVRDFAEVRLEGVVTAAAAERALELLEVDERGLDRLDRAILRTICEKFEGGPVGLSTLAIAVGEERDTLEDVYEPYLLTEGLIKRTPRGRAATPAAFAHLGLEPPPSGGPSLF